MIPFAKTVVWRHPCDCPTASRPLEPGEEAEHRFDVDGKPFPWLIAENGARFVKRGEVYLVTVDVFPLTAANHEPLRTIVDLDGLVAFEHVTGERTVFPWALTADPITVVAEPRAMVTITLTFIAEHVDADIDIPVESDEVPE